MILATKGTNTYAGPKSPTSSFSDIPDFRVWNSGFLTSEQGTRLSNSDQSSANASPASVSLYLVRSREDAISHGQLENEPQGRAHPMASCL